MRISDWSSDVCSSDLRNSPFRQLRRNEIAGAVFLEGGFGMTVDVVADRHQFDAVGLQVAKGISGHGILICPGWPPAQHYAARLARAEPRRGDRKSTRLNSSH